MQILGVVSHKKKLLGDFWVPQTLSLLLCPPPSNAVRSTSLALPVVPHPSARGVLIVSTQGTIEVYQTSHYRVGHHAVVT